MRMTPTEAASTWCPMARIARREEVRQQRVLPSSEDHAVIIGGCNRDVLGDTDSPASCRCLADCCAMWRWQAKFGHRTIVKTDGPPGRENYTAQVYGPIPPTHGYCGLAGRPEILE